MTNDEMFKLLQSHIGDAVTYTGWDYGVITMETDILCEVEPYKYIVLGNTTYPFIGYGSAIVCIHDTKRNILYSNPNVQEKYNLRDASLINEKRKASFGDNSLYDENSNNIDCSIQEKANLIIKGRELLDSIYHDEMMYFIDQFVIDGNSYLIMKASLEMIEKLSESDNLVDAREEILNKYNFNDLYKEAFDNVYTRFLDFVIDNKVLVRK